MLTYTKQRGFTMIQQDQKECKGRVMEINVAFFIGYLKDVIIQPPTRKA